MIIFRIPGKAGFRAGQTGHVPRAPPTKWSFAGLRGRMVAGLELLVSRTDRSSGRSGRGSWAGRSWKQTSSTWNFPRSASSSPPLTAMITPANNNNKNLYSYSGHVLAIFAEPRPIQHKNSQFPQNYKVKKQVILVCSTYCAQWFSHNYVYQIPNCLKVNSGKFEIISNLVTEKGPKMAWTGNLKTSLNNKIWDVFVLNTYSRTWMSCSIQAARSPHLNALILTSLS